MPAIGVVERTRWLSVACVALLTFGCQPAAPEPPTTPPPTKTDFGLTLQGTGGTYSDGSGLLGVAILSTLRDDSGRGPQGGWVVKVSSTSGAASDPVPYDDATDGSYVAWWFPDIPFAEERFFLRAEGAEGKALDVSFIASSESELPPAVVDLSADGQRLDWALVPTALSYRCNVTASGRLQHTSLSSMPGCDVSALPPGTYQAAVLAFSADLPALKAETSRSPELPPSFSVSEARLAFVKPSAGGSPLVARAAGGAIHYGPSTPGLAVWLSISAPDGSPSTDAWEVELFGPGLPTSAPLRFSYPAATARFISWAYDVPATPGRYSVVATSPAGSVSTSFSVGALPWLDAPSNVTAQGRANGGADIQWSAVAGARSYFVGVWERSTGNYKAGQWTAQPSTQFGSQSFTSGTSYDVYVAATSADMVAAQAPTSIVVSENTFDPASFTGQ